MSYRNYIGSITTKEYDKIKKFNKKELYQYKNKKINDLENVSVYDIAENTLYELGKYVDEFPKDLFKPFFLNKELQKDFTKDYDFYIVDKEFLEAVLNRYHNKIKDYYNKMLEPLLTKDKYPRLKDPKDYDKMAIYELAEHIKSMAFEWGCLPYKNTPPYNLKNGETITTSSKYEYAQFELVRIYKTFDFDKKILIYYGF